MSFDALTIGGALAAFLSGGIMLGVVRHQAIVRPGARSITDGGARSTTDAGAHPSARPGTHRPGPPSEADQRS